MNAGFYKDLISTGSGTSITYNHGQIITKSYILRIENSAATPLELCSAFPGGISNPLPTSDPIHTPTSLDYDKNRRYDIVPISLSGFGSSTTNTSPKQMAPFQSTQVLSEWLYVREKSVGLDEDLYLTESEYGTPLPSTLVPGSWHLIPTPPSLVSGGNVDIWNGLYSAGGTGGGLLTEFCIHKDHPDVIQQYSILPSPGRVSFYADDLGTPITGSTYNMKYPKFLHALYFSEDSTSPFGKKQLQTRTTTNTTPSFYPSTNVPNFIMIPAKLGFYKNDEFLVGKYTCGSYLYLAPIDNTDIAVEGSTDLAKKMLEFGEDKGINIPLIFQFRCSDKLGYIGGYRTTGNISNISYVKKIGLDIQVRGEAPFSFDIEVSCKYAQDSLAQPVYVPNVSLDRLNQIRQAK